jgi:hypothetical protein
VSLTPIVHGHEAALANHLTGLQETGGPLAQLPSVHFGRWLVIDRLKMSWPGAPRQPTRLQSQYLLFTASLTAPAEGTYARRLPGSFLTELAAAIPDDADAIWRHCVGYPGVTPLAAFVRYLTTSQLDTLLFHVGYPDVTVGEVRQALAARDGLASFARNHQDEANPAVLQEAYLKESATWFP